MNLIAEGAEAKVFSDGKRVVKERAPKKYRLREIEAAQIQDEKGGEGF
ncbi:hypothetical protein HYU15_00225 [Candidatus Woesearchaeota archaeon]|nr:hypothetical protein [Candidatus Woesearchaeota archaeon]